MRFVQLDLHDRWEEPPPDHRALVRYLESGVVLRRVRSRTIDLVHPTRGKSVPGSILTDGEWIWPAGHAHYVERYAVRLPDDFLLHVRSAGHVMPTVDFETVRSLAEEARRHGI